MNCLKIYLTLSFIITAATGFAAEPCDSDDVVLDFQAKFSEIQHRDGEWGAIAQDLKRRGVLNDVERIALPAAAISRGKFTTSPELDFNLQKMKRTVQGMVYLQLLIRWSQRLERDLAPTSAAEIFLGIVNRETFVFRIVDHQISITGKVDPQTVLSTTLGSSFVPLFEMISAAPDLDFEEMELIYGRVLFASMGQTSFHLNPQRHEGNVREHFITALRGMAQMFLMERSFLEAGDSIRMSLLFPFFNPHGKILIECPWDQSAVGFSQWLGPALSTALTTPRPRWLVAPIRVEGINVGGFYSVSSNTAQAMLFEMGEYEAALATNFTKNGTYEFTRVVTELSAPPK